MRTMANKLPLASILKALDAKDRGFFDKLTAEQQKEIQPYVLIRYMAFVRGSPELREWYLRATNTYINVGFWDVNSKHKKLLWNLLCDISPGMGNQYHEWVPPQKKAASKRMKTLEEIYPDMGDQELETMNVVCTDDEIKELLKERGWDNKSIKAAL